MEKSTGIDRSSSNPAHRDPDRVRRRSDHPHTTGCDGDEDLCKIRVDAPVAKFIGVGQCGPLDLAAEAHVVELAADRLQAGFDVAQTITVG